MNKKQQSKQLKFLSKTDKEKSPITAVSSCTDTILHSAIIKKTDTRIQKGNIKKLIKIRKHIKCKCFHLQNSETIKKCYCYICLAHKKNKKPYMSICNECILYSKNTTLYKELKKDFILKIFINYKDLIDKKLIIILYKDNSDETQYLKPIYFGELLDINKVLLKNTVSDSINLINFDNINEVSLKNTETDPINSNDNDWNWKWPDYWYLDFGDSKYKFYERSIFDKELTKIFIYSEITQKTWHYYFNNSKYKEERDKKYFRESYGDMFNYQNSFGFVEFNKTKNLNDFMLVPVSNIKHQLIYYNKIICINKIKRWYKKQKIINKWNETLNLIKYLPFFKFSENSENQEIVKKFLGHSQYLKHLYALDKLKFIGKYSRDLNEHFNSLIN